MGIKSLFFKLFIFTILFIPSFVFAEFKNEDVTKVDELIKSGKYIVVDVRTPEEYAAGHIKGALNIDYYDNNFENMVQEKLIDKNKPYILYCRTGARSSYSARMLDELGYKDVTNMKGGIVVWKNVGKALE